MECATKMWGTMDPMLSKIQNVNLDAWSDGQIQSKLWLCRVLENQWNVQTPSHFWIYGAWYGILAQFLLVREKIAVRHFDLFDIDSEALSIAQALTSSWWIQKKVSFGFHHRDCDDVTENEIQQNQPDLVINTSCEHFQCYQWFHNLPKGQKFLLQSTNMQHPTHILRPNSLSNFIDQLGPVSEIWYQDVLPVRYPHFEFDRYMVMGQK